MISQSGARQDWMHQNDLNHREMTSEVKRKMHRKMLDICKPIRTNKIASSESRVFTWKLSYSSSINPAAVSHWKKTAQKIHGKISHKLHFVRELVQSLAISVGDSAFVKRKEQP